MRKIVISIFTALMILMPLKVNALPDDKIVVHYFYKDG